MGTKLFRFTALAALVALAGCTVHKQSEAPSLTGPSDSSTSLQLQITPDTIFQDGQSQALVTILALGPTGQPARNLTLLTEIQVGGATTDFGRLSARSLVTDANGKATVTYTAPPAPPIASSNGTVVGIAVTPMGTDFANSMSRVVTVRLVSPGTIGAPPSSLRVGITLPNAVVGDTAVFTANVTDSTGADASAQVASYQWNFGDGGTATGRTASHTYRDSGNFAVTLTIIDALGRVGQAVQSLTVGGGVNPTATFVVSPSSPNVGQSVSFNASGATAAPGHSITNYTWDFGDGSSPGSGRTTSHSYGAAGTYSVVLTTTDDVGRTGSSSTNVTVGVGGLNADFNFSPTSPAVGTNVSFDASTSSASTGRTITGYAWNFDDGSPGSGAQTTHIFRNTGTFNVRLTITDDLGKTATTTKAVVVGGSNPTATFTFTPSQPVVNQTVTFDASQSRPAPGRTISQYAWNFDDGGIAFGVTAPHAFAVARTYQVRLTVTDDFGTAVTTSNNVVVTASTDAPPTARLVMNPATTVINSPIQADGCASTATPGLTITKYEFNWGDNRADSIVSGANCRVTHSYSTLGSYTVTLIVTDSANKIGSTTAGVTINSGAPATAVFTYSPASPVAIGTTVTVDASNSQASQNATITSYEWTFGDSTQVVTSTSPTGVTHTYNTACTCTITLTVHDNQGNTNPSSTTTRTITVGPSASFVSNPGPNVSGGATVNFDGAGSAGSPGAPIVNYTWNWGDGTPQTSSGSPTASHVFAGPIPPATSVDRFVTLTVTDSRGAQSSVSKKLTVQ